MEQRRASKRSRTLLEGQIVFNNRLSRMECTVRDLSETGARIVFGQPGPVPPEFELHIPKKKMSRQAQVMWYDGQNHGVMFVGEGEAQDPGALIDLLKKPKVKTSPSSIRGVQDVLDDARRQIAQLAGMPVEAVRLKVEIDY